MLITRERIPHRPASVPAVSLAAGTEHASHFQTPPCLLPGGCTTCYPGVRAPGNRGQQLPLNRRGTAAERSRHPPAA
ncbi:hypothetical protein V5799_003274 [Amblyomma americanum]|uniref:Uncharacterized protein n=1 Tax=Amblyomma americanum TaxID=6943 RepID=A0AAQ4D9F5_AMBAM